MEFVQPIRDKKLIEDVKNKLLKNGSRNLMLFVFGINTGLRISNILKLKANEVKNLTHVITREKKQVKKDIS